MATAWPLATHKHKSCMPKRLHAACLYHMPKSTRAQAMQATTELTSLHLCHSWDDSGGNAVRALVTDQQNRVRSMPSP